MPDRIENKIRLEHILDAAGEIDRYIHGISYERFIDDSMIYNACIRQLEIIGEACTKLSPDIKEMDANVPWRQIIGLRNILIHHYFGVDVKLIWDIIQNDIPDFRKRVSQMLLILE